MSNVSSGFIGVTKGRNGSIVHETFRLTPKEVWDAIFYGIEKANAQYPREKAPKMLGNKWQVVGVQMTFPPNFDVQSDGVAVRF